jgi:hypothetical protein
MKRHILNFFPYVTSAAIFGTALGCTPPAVPPAVGEADAILERHDAKTVSAARPRLVAEARELSRRAREAAEKGETEQATLLARQAVQKFQTAKNFAEREQAERMLSALEKSGTVRREPRDDVGTGRPGAREAVARAEDARETAARTGARASALAEGDEVLRAARRALDSETWDRARAHANEARALFEGGAGKSFEREVGGSFRTLAERALVALALRRGELLGQLRDQSCAAPFREFEAILELGQRRFDAGDYERAYEFSLRAEERLRVCDPRTAPQLPAAQTKREADEEAARKKATASLQKAQIELSRVQAQNREDPAAIQGQALLQSGDTWYARHAYAEANDLATRAYAVLSRVKAAPQAPAAPAVGRDDAVDALTEARLERDRTPDSTTKSRGLELFAQAERAFAAKTYGDAKATAKRATEAFRAASRENACDTARSRVTSARDLDQRLGRVDTDPRKATARRTALADLSAAENKLTDKSCGEALTLAERGRAALQSLAGEPKGRDGQPRAWDVALSAIKEAERARDDAHARGSATTTIERGDVALKTANLAYGKEDFSDAERSAREARELYAETSDVLDPPIGSATARAEEYLTKHASSLAATEATSPGYRGAYAAIFRALATREDAARESPFDTDKMARADLLLSTAKEAWQKRLFADADRAAASANVILAKLAAPSAEELSPAESERARARAASLVASAGELATACQKARCEERDTARSTEARAMLTAARRALATRRPKASGDLARAAEERWLATLEKPRKGHEIPKPDTDAKKAELSDAEARLRDAEAARRVCESRACIPETVRSAREAFYSAKIARADGLYEASAKSARDAEGLFRSAVVAVFEIPPQVREVARVGNQLVPTPALAFKAGQKDLAPSSDVTLAALARTISDNARALRRVRLVVAPEARGNPAQNKKVAESRAEALRVALVGRGAPPELLSSESAAADSEANAPSPNTVRVDIVLELGEGVK